MVPTSFLYTVLTAAALFDGGLASPCKPSPPTSSSTAAISSTYAELTSSSTIAVSTSASATSSSTLESSWSSSSVISTTSSIDVISSTLTMSSSSVEITPSSTVEITSSSTAELTSTSAIESTSSSTVEFSSSSTAEPSFTSTTFTSSEVTPALSSTSASSSTSDVPTSTSSLPPVLPTFALVAANSLNTEVNGQTLKWRAGSAGAPMYLIAPTYATSAYTSVGLTLEEGTNKLIVAGVSGYYVITTSTRILYTGLATQVGPGGYYIVCDSPVREGEALSCQASGASPARTQFMTSLTNTAVGSVLYLEEPDTTTTNITPVDLFAVAV